MTLLIYSCQGWRVERKTGITERLYPEKYIQKKNATYFSAKLSRDDTVYSSNSLVTNSIPPKMS